MRAEETAALIHFVGGHNTAGPGKGAAVSRKSSPPTAGLPQAPVKSNRSRADKATIRCLPQEVPQPFRQNRLKCTGLCLAVCRSTSQQSHERLPCETPSHMEALPSVISTGRGGNSQSLRSQLVI